MGCQGQTVGYPTKCGCYKLCIGDEVAMEDKRPAGLVGHEKEVVHDNLELVQKTLGYSNSQMAELLGVELKYYERIKKNGGPLDYERLNRLYHNANVDLNRLLTNDVQHDIIRERANDEAVDYRVLVDNLLIEISNTPDYEKRVDMVLHTYLRFGEYIKKVLKNREGFEFEKK